MLQGLLLQVLLQGVAVEWPRRVLLRLVTLPVASWQHGILGEQEVKCYVDVALRREDGAEENGRTDGRRAEWKSRMFRNITICVRTLKDGQNYGNKWH